MPKGHPIFVTRVWPGHRDYRPEDALGYDAAEAAIEAEQALQGLALANTRSGYPDLGQHDDITQERLDDPEAEEANETEWDPERGYPVVAGEKRSDQFPRYPDCPVPGGTCLLCDDDHCREL